MQNSKTNPANPASQPTLPFSTEPINWLEPVECSFVQLRDVVATAERAGFRPARMHVIGGGYRLEFKRKPFATEPLTAKAGPPEKS